MMYQTNHYHRPEMGCGSSKTVSTAVAGRTNNTNGYNARAGSSSSLKENNHTEIAVFGPNDVDIPNDPVDNAKPRLLHSAIGRGNNQNRGPITPFLGNQELSPRVSEPKSQRSGIRRGSSPTIERTDSHREVLPSTSATKADSLSLSGESASLKTSNDHYISSQLGLPRLQINENKDDLLDCNTSRTNLSGSRASSAKAGSVLTTTALNTSIVTSYDGDDFHSELALGTPHTHTSMTDYECSTFRTMSITPSVHASVDATPIAMHEKNIGPIMEEYEGGFTPRSIHNGDAKGSLDPTQKFTPREVFQHNRYVGWNEWSMYRGKLYDNRILKETFTPLIETFREKRDAEKLEYKKQKEAEMQKMQDDDDSDVEGKTQKLRDGDIGDSDSDDIYSDYSEYGDWIDYNKDDLTSLWTWNTNGIRLVLRNGLDKKIVEDHLPSACIGTIARPSDKKYWEDVRNDIKLVLDDLNREDAKDELSIYVAEYLHLLQRWIRKYRELCPDNSTIPGGDPNQICFPLPDGIDQNPECLRAWVDTWQCFDLEISENGAWAVIEVEDIDLGDPHEIFVATLKAHVNLTPLDTEVDGEAGWMVIQEGLFADDVMTEEQKLTEQRRNERTDLYDEGRMKRRRHRILKYFMDKYEYSRSDIEHYLNWADEMERGEKKFLSLC